MSTLCTPFRSSNWRALQIQHEESSVRNHLRTHVSISPNGSLSCAECFGNEWKHLQPSIFSQAFAASVRSWKLMNAKPFARPVSLSLARKTRVTRPNRSNISRKSFSSANSETCRSTIQYIESLRPYTGQTRHRFSRDPKLTFVTLNVARSSLSYFPPILSPAPAAPPFLRCGGT